MRKLLALFCTALVLLWSVASVSADAGSLLVELQELFADGRGYDIEQDADGFVMNPVFGMISGNGANGISVTRYSGISGRCCIYDNRTDGDPVGLFGTDSYGLVVLGANGTLLLYDGEASAGVMQRFLLPADDASAAQTMEDAFQLCHFSDVKDTDYAATHTDPDTGEVYGWKNPDTGQMYQFPQTCRGSYIMPSANGVYFGNLPCFSSQAACIRYLETGDYSGADNADAVDAAVSQPDNAVSVPENVQVKNAGDFYDANGHLSVGNVKVGWSGSTDDGAVYDVSFRAYMKLYKKRLDINWKDMIAGVLSEYEGKNVQSVTGAIAAVMNSVGMEPYLLSSGFEAWQDAGVFRLNANGNGEAVLSNDDILKYLTSRCRRFSECQDYVFSKIEVRVRRRVGRKYSLWRVVSINYEDDSAVVETRDDDDMKQEDDSSTEEAPGEDSSTEEPPGEDSSTEESSTVETDGNGNISIIIDNSNENNNTNNNTNNNDNSNAVDQIVNGGGGDGDDGGIDWDFLALLGFIKKGFGLLGDTGFIALLSALFPFLPAEIFVILTMGVAVAVAIMIINLVKRLFS